MQGDYIFTRLDRESPTAQYNLIRAASLTRDQMKRQGYPLMEPGRRVVIPPRPKEFATTQDPEDQKCACGKKFSVRDPFWYIAEKGCHYHPSKKYFDTASSVLRYQCCHRASDEEGCKTRQYHVSSLHPVDIVPFRMSQPRPVHMWHDLEIKDVFGLDTEMCFTTAGMEVVKVSLVWYNGRVLYSTFVKPKNKILDYNTEFSGVSAKDLEHITTVLEDVQHVLLRYIHEDSIVIGHSLENDFLGLHLVHTMVVDTAFAFPHKRGFPYRNSLKSLASHCLMKKIQQDSCGHDSIEDARTCLELIMNKIDLDMRYSNGAPDRGYGTATLRTDAPRIAPPANGVPRVNTANGMVVPRLITPNSMVPRMPTLSNLSTHGLSLIRIQTVMFHSNMYPYQISPHIINGAT